MSDESAHHEAGHAFMAVYCGARVRSVTIEPDWDDGPARFGDVQIEWPAGRFSPRNLRKRLIQVALAGPVAEMIHTGEPYHPGFVPEWALDWQLAWQEASPLVPDQKQRLAYLEETTRQLYQLLDRDDHWAAVAAIVDELLAHETLDGDDIIAIVRQWLR